MTFVLLVLLAVIIAYLLWPRREYGGGAEVPEFTIYYSNECPYCVKAIKLLGEKKVTYSAVEIDDFKALLVKLGSSVPSTHRTKPIIFRNGKFLGGYTELVEYFRLKTK